MAKRDVPAIAVSEARAGAYPLAPPPPVFLFDIRRGRAADATGECIVALDSKRRLIVPGAYRLTGHIVIELDDDLTDEQLRELVVPIEPGKAVLTPEEEARRTALRERAKHLAEAYRAKVDAGPEDLERALFNWLNEGIPEDALREAFIATAAAMTVSKLDTPQDRYAYLREVVRIRRRSQKPKPNNPKP